MYKRLRGGGGSEIAIIDKVSGIIRKKITDFFVNEFWDEPMKESQKGTLGEIPVKMPTEITEKSGGNKRRNGRSNLGRKD